MKKISLFLSTVWDKSKEGLQLTLISLIAIAVVYVTFFVFKWYIVWIFLYGAVAMVLLAFLIEFFINEFVNWCRDVYREYNRRKGE